ncbi:MAG: efflux RND transporter permease subunit [Wenzhouxiangellaceae bacterium]|nr:efflux RND transporter permease subunit [Wenzhouxiangellaceae bacterium]
MNAIFFALERRRLILAFAGLLSIIGILAWQQMNRQEDPFFPYRYGQVLVQWPGADPAEVERLVLNPLEEELAQLEEVNEVIGTVRLGLAHVWIGMHQHIYDTDEAWDRIRNAVAEAERDFPPGPAPADIQDRSMDAHAVVLAVTGNDDLLELLEASRRLRRDLFRIKDIATIDIIADPGEQLLITIDPSRATALGVDIESLAGQLADRNRTLAGGTLDIQGRSLVLDPATEFASLESLRQTPIRTAAGALLPLAEIADITLGAEQPATERMWSDGRPSVGLGLVFPDNRVNAVELGHEVQALVDDLRADYAPLVIEEMFFQPRWVQRRLSELGTSLLIGVSVVALILLLFMGARMGLLVASLLPLVTFSALAIFAVGGGVLHQMAIAGMVIALGMLVDNAIVMVENLQWHLDRGMARAQACSTAVRELAGPLAAATGTTLAAFTPLLLSAGDTADFTRGIPIMVMLTLTVSYFYALLVTPILGAAVLKPGPDRGPTRIEALGHRLANAGSRHPVAILAVTGAMLIGAVVLTLWLPREFFPSTDRNQLLIEMNFPEGTRTGHSALMANSLAQDLRIRPEVEKVHVFAGFSGPRFFYNLAQIPASPHLARLVVVTRSDRDLPALIDTVRRQAPVDFPEAQVVAHRLGQGPPINAPIEIRLYSESAIALQRSTDAVMAAVRSTPGAEDVRHKLGTGIPTLAFEIDDAEAARYGVARAEIGQLLADATRGREFSTWRLGREPVSMRIRSPEGEQFPVHALEGLTIETNAGALPLTQFVSSSVRFQPAVISHYDLRRVTTVLAETAEGFTYNDVLDRLKPKLETLDGVDGVEFELAGAAAEAGNANSALFSALPLGVLLLLVFLLWQFNSFRLVAIVLATVPLAAIGVVPGLILAGQSFSFTAILGVVALIGIVVNNAIVLIDVAERQRAAGAGLTEAVHAAVIRRTRPILLTTATTIAGLLPLTLTQSTLWPPMAWAIISGLASSTALTLLVIPVLYRLLMGLPGRHPTAPAQGQGSGR